MTSAKMFLGAVHHISEHSIFFLPSNRTNLDLKTLSTAPPCHRTALQRNGLVAKVYAAVTFTEDAEVGMQAARYVPPQEEYAAIQREAQSLMGRQDLWRSALTYAGLLKDKDAALTVPDTFKSVPWPLLTEAQYADFVKQANARATCAAVKSSAFCVPLLSVQEYVYQRQGVRLSLAVMWMPCYPKSLRSWAASFEAASQRIPESTLIALAHHMTIAQLTLRSGDTMAGRSEKFSAAAPSLDSVLVHKAEDEERSKEGSEEPVFVMAASASPNSESRRGSVDNVNSIAATVVAAVAAGEEGGPCQQDLYRPPEECTPRLYPALVTGTTKKAVWAMGVVLYLLASGRAALQTPPDVVAGAAVELRRGNETPTLRSPRRARVVEEAPFNAASMTPEAVWKRVRRDLERRGYRGVLTTLVVQLLSLDPLTRPSLTTVDRLLQDLHRSAPIHRFPFVVGSYDLLRLPNPAALVSINPGARRYSFADVCVLCKKQRASTPVCAKGGDHQSTGVTSPSWNDDECELLPTVSATDASVYMTYLYPICGASIERLRRKHVAHALQHANASMSAVMSSGNASANTSDAAAAVAPLNCSFLFQVFGGYAVYVREQEKNAKGHVVYRVKVLEVLIPYPTHGLRRNELSLVKTTLHFSGALPWPSCCTEVLQKSGRVSRHVPFALTGAHHDVEWFGWVLPGERFAMPNGAHWTAPADGAFVFWFSSDLQPTDRDRYFAVTSVRGASLLAKVSRTVLPDSLFRQHVGDENQTSTLLMRSMASSTHTESPSGQSARSPGASAVRRRSIQSVTDVVLPAATREIVEEDVPGEDVDGDAVRLHGAFSRPLSRIDSTDADGAPSVASSSVSARRRRSSATRPRRSPSCQVSILVDYAAVPDSSSSNNAAAGGISRGQRAAAPRRHTAPEPRAVAAASHLYDATTTSITGAAAALQDESQTPKKRMTTMKASAGGSGMAEQNNSDTMKPAAETLSPKCRTPAPREQIPSRESTQPPSHRDTSARSERALAPLPSNNAAQATAAANDLKKRKSRVMVAADTQRAAADHENASPCAAAAVSAAKTSPPTSASDVGGAAGQQKPSPHRMPTRLSPRPLRRPASPGSAGNSARRPLFNGFSTPTFATPKLTPLTGGVAALMALRLCGAWLPADTVDATFQALTFWVFSTGEHGYMHPPTKLSPAVGYAIRAPPGAAYVAFLSNQAPLFRRNHPRMDVAVFSPRLPHHGLACYDAEGRLLGVLALRCSVRDDADVQRGEFAVESHPREPLSAAQVSARTVYASYLSGSVGDEKVLVRETVPMQHHHLRHTASSTQAGLDSRTLFNSPSEAQTLTFTSARHLVGEFTPNDKDDFAVDRDAATVLPACWLGFDGDTASLLFADVSQSVWVPYSIGVI